MARTSKAQHLRSPLVDAWPPDDTEESILGIHLHQTTIRTLTFGLNEAAMLHTPPGQPPPWTATCQLLVLGCRRRNGSLIRTYPDIFVYRQPIDPLQGTFRLDKDGPPLLIIEVLSESTCEKDLDMERGKGYSYALAGVREYLTIDPTWTYLAAGIRAWRLEGGAYQPWEPAADGRWYSTEIAAAVALKGMLARVYTPDGQEIPLEGGIMQALAARDAEIERLRRILSERPE